MPSFTTRVELHGATERDYETLHAAMQAEGFSRIGLTVAFGIICPQLNMTVQDNSLAQKF